MSDCVEMNLVKASIILYPILGENVSNIILSYMKPNIPKIKPKRPNMYKFFKENGLVLSKVDRAYDDLKHYYEEGESDCYKSAIDHRECKDERDPGHICSQCDLDGMIMEYSKFSKWVEFSDSTADALSREIERSRIETHFRKAFLVDYYLDILAKKQIQFE